MAYTDQLEQVLVTFILPMRIHYRKVVIILSGTLIPAIPVCLIW